MFLKIAKCKYLILCALFFVLSFHNILYAQGDNPCTATAITPVTGTTCTPGTNYSLAGLTSTTVANAPNPGCFYSAGGTPDGWLTFTTTTAQNFFITTNSATIVDSGIALYVQSGTCDNLTLITCDDDGGPGAMSQITAANRPAGTYFIRFWDQAASNGSLNLCLAINVPPGDNPCSAWPITPVTSTTCTPGTNYSLAGLTSTTVANAPNPGCFYSAGGTPDGWLTFTTTTAQNFFITTNSATIVDSGIALYVQSGTCDNLTLITCDDDGGPGAMSQITAANRPAGTYFIRFWDQAASNGSLNLCLATANVVLPIELKSFTGNIEGEINVLNWETLSEKNMQWHIVERSADGINWREIGHKNGLLNSTLPTKYTLEDRAPLAKAYYRLSSVDMDGKERYSLSILLVRNRESFGIISVFPSPTKDNVTVQFNATQEEIMTVQVMDMTGRLVLSKTVDASKATNEIPLELTILQAGVYSVTVKSSDNISRPVRFVKQ